MSAKENINEVLNEEGLNKEISEEDAFKWLF